MADGLLVLISIEYSIEGIWLSFVGPNPAAVAAAAAAALLAAALAAELKSDAAQVFS